MTCPRCNIMRQSNMEMVRIVAMSMIVIWHFFIHGGGFEGYATSIYFAPLMIAGVDLFIMLSGYFLIKFRWRALLKLAVVLFVFQAVSALLKFAVTGTSIENYRLVLMFISPVTKAPYWFITIYAALMVLSPVLNVALRQFDIKTLRWSVGLLSFVEFYSCWALCSIDSAGNGFFTFVYLYILGYYLSIEPYFRRISSTKVVVVAIVAMMANVLFNMYVQHTTVLYQSYFPAGFAFSLPLKYSNPLIIVFSAAVILWFAKHPFSSKTINSIAGSALGVYLLQEGFTCIWVYEKQKEFLDDKIEFFAVCAFLFVLYWILSWAIMLLVNPLSAWFTKIVKRRIPSSWLFSFE